LVFTGGGTGGHIYPGLAVVEALRARAFAGRIAWIGSNKNSDREAVEAAGIEFFPIPAGKLRRKFSLTNVADAFRVLAGYFGSRRILKSLKPVLLFSKGGYVSVPPCAAAASLGIPYFTHESDVTPGLATRLNAGRAETIVLSYEETRELLPAASRAKAVVAGNPVRAVFHSAVEHSAMFHRTAFRNADPARGRAQLGVPDGLPIVFFLGGSQGARQINELCAAAFPRLRESAFVVHQTGESGAGGAPSAAFSNGPRYRSFSFIREEMSDLLAAADLVVGRAGAGTLWECAALGKPMILVPLCGSGTRGDQVDNAALFARCGAAISLVGQEATADRLVPEILGLLSDRRRLTALGEAARALAGRDAASEIAELILKRIGELP
jgi:UDP-N-acetylglucosamine--N-acetylmuramyl-(pentapeptide) pyrophosphoryl-undecaprenol N-acetylglucosamine transferase